MVLNFTMLLRNNPNYPIFQIFRRISFIHCWSLFEWHYPKTDYSKIFMPLQIGAMAVIEPENVRSPFLYILSPVADVLSITSALLAKKLWQNLQPETKENIWRNIRKMRKRIALCGLLTSAFLIFYCIEHIVETPITKRKKFNILKNRSREELNKILEMKEMKAYKDKILPKDHGYCKRTRKIVKKILSANRDIPEIRTGEWGVILIDEPGMVNAISLPNGTIALFTGLFEICSNDDQLAAIISHEMSHIILDHYLEDFSRKVAVQSSLFFLSFLVWLYFRKFRAFMFDSLLRILVYVLIHLPYSRKVELEADSVGIFLCATSCFDVREAVGLWKKLHWQPNQLKPEWLSSHPSYEKRFEHLLRIVPHAWKLRSQTNCPTLKNFQNFSNRISNAKRRTVCQLPV